MSICPIVIKWAIGFYGKKSWWAKSHKNLCTWQNMARILQWHGCRKIKQVLGHAEGNYLVYEFGVMGTQTRGTRIFTRVQRGLKSKILILLSLLAMTILFLSNVTHVICSVEPLNVCMLLSSVILQYLISPSLPLDTITPWPRVGSVMSNLMDSILLWCSSYVLMSFAESMPAPAIGKKE